MKHSSAVFGGMLASALCVAGVVRSQPTQTAPAQSTPAQQATSGAGPAASLSAGLDSARETDYLKAEKILRSIGGADRAKALLALARIQFEQGRFSEADALVQHASTSAEQKLAALALRGEILSAQGKVDEAIRLLTPHADGQGAGGRRVRLVLGELLIRAGRRADAEPLLLKFADEYGNDAIGSTDAEGLAMVGRAMHLLRHAKDANVAYNESERAERGRIETLLWRADLYVDKYDPGHAEEVLGEALKIASHRADAMVALARVKLEEALDFDAAEKLVADALKVNPKHKGAFAVRASIALHDGDLTRANAAVDAGLAIDENDLELLSLRAAARFLADDKTGFERAKEAVFARNKEFSQAYGIIGEYAEWEHRYSDVISMMQQAVALDPQDSKAWAQLGLMQARAGDESNAVKTLQTAWSKDHFNVRVYNTLELLYDKWIPQLYDSESDGIFHIRYPKNEKALLQRYVPRMLGEAWGRLKLHYMFAPSTPVAVEMYQERQHFSVRTSGLPNVGIQGVCFGHVLAAMSPGSDAFNWGNVLWHELAHVFAIQQSNSHVPRWFTEGLSEYETMIRRPEWHRSLDRELYLALRANRLPGALVMNSAFTHAEGDLEVTVAYYAASQMLMFTAEQFGFPAITRALELWGEGKTTDAVFREAFGVTAEDYDACFRRWALERLARYRTQYMFEVKVLPLDDAREAVTSKPRDAAAHVIYALALLRAHKPQDGSREIEAALEIEPNNKDAQFVAAKLAAANQNVDGEEKHLHLLKAGGGDGYELEMSLAEVARAHHDRIATRAALEAAHKFDPTQAEPLRGLLDLADDDKRDADSLEALRALTMLDQHDRRAWRLLLQRLVAGKRWQDAKRVGESALYVDVETASTHIDYAKALSATGDHESAAFELESALLCDAKPDEKAVAQSLLARERSLTQ